MQHGSRMRDSFVLLWAIFSLVSTYPSGNEKEKNPGPSIEKLSQVLRISSAWLNDLEESYRVGFQKQFSLIQYRNSSTVPNQNYPRGDESWCQNVSFLSVEQNKRLFDEYGYDTVLSSTIHSMSDNPRARLFEFEDHWGDSEVYRFWNFMTLEGTCTTLRRLNRKVRSVFTFGKCIRLFEKQDCRGWSIAIYPGCSNSHRFKVPRHVKFHSIGPCLDNEFSTGALNTTFPGFVVKNPELRSYNPDLVRMFNPDIELGGSKIFNDLDIKYLLGPGNRTEIIEARIRRLNCRSFPKLNVTEMDFHKQLEKEHGDILGHAIPTTIGGPVSESFNIFPADQDALIDWDDVICSIFEQSDNTLILQFVYENENKTRPVFFYYWLETYALSAVTYGRIINGHRQNLRLDRPYSEIIPKYKHTGNITISLSKILNLKKAISKTRQSVISNNSVRNLKERDQILGLNLRKCKQLHCTESQVSKENVTELISTIQGMIRNPMVRLFNGENLTGNFEDFHIGKFSDTKGCYNLPKVMTVKSAETFGKCVRLFNQPKCKSLSLAVYGRIENSKQRIDKFLDRVWSIGPCLEYEFLNAVLSDKIKGYVVKDLGSSSYFPDLVQFPGFRLNRKYQSVSSGQTTYFLDPTKRITLIKTYVRTGVTVPFPNTLHVEEIFKPIDGKDGDVPCFYIPLAIGGPANESFNVFPTSQSKCNDWLQIFPICFCDANELIYFLMELHFVYKNDNGSSRPQFVYYHFDFLRDNKNYYGRYVC